MRPFSRRIRNLFSTNPKSVYNAEAVEAREAAFYKGYLREGMTAFDVGSNVGEVAALFSERVGATGRVHCFEPGEAAFARLGVLAERLPHRNLTVNCSAVGETAG